MDWKSALHRIKYLLCDLQFFVEPVQSFPWIKQRSWTSVKLYLHSSHLHNLFLTCPTLLQGDHKILTQNCCLGFRVEERSTYPKTLHWTVKHACRQPRNEDLENPVNRGNENHLIHGHMNPDECVRRIIWRAQSSREWGMVTQAGFSSPGYSALWAVEPEGSADEVLLICAALAPNTQPNSSYKASISTFTTIIL